MNGSQITDKTCRPYIDLFLRPVSINQIRNVHIYNHANNINYLLPMYGSSYSV